ncbi:MAG: hypothetical protein KGI33_08720 [Thaumarchaeota archaeon]|nr:hypothetical protein [Nitrososphaerota archaeon]
MNLFLSVLVVLIFVSATSLGFAYATVSKNVYNLSVGGREFVVSYDISNATVNEIHIKKFLSYTNHYWYSFMIPIGNSTTDPGMLTITLPSELMVSTCQSGILPKISLNNNVFTPANMTSETKTDSTILVKLPPFTKTVEINGYGPDPSNGCPTFAYKMTYNGTIYWIDYKSNPEIQDIRMNEKNSSIVVTLSHLYHFPPPQPWSYVDIQIPRNLLDSKIGQNDVPFTVTVDGNMTQIQEIETTNTTRTIHIPLRGGLYYQDNEGEIVITGTATAPEFQFVIPILLIGVTALIIFYKVKIVKLNSST